MEQRIDSARPAFAWVGRWTLGSWRIGVERRMFAAETLVQRYDCAANNWSRTLHRLGFDAAYQALAMKMVELYPERFTAGSAVLDCGAGSGALSLALAHACDAPLSHHLFDASAGMLDVAANALRSAGVAAAGVAGNISRMPYEDASFDVVVAAHVLEHMPEPQRALAELRRVLKPNGLLLLCVTRRGALGALVQLKWRIHCVDARQVAGRLEACGFARIRLLRLGGSGWCARMSVACVAELR